MKIEQMRMSTWVHLGFIPETKLMCLDKNMRSDFRCLSLNKIFKTWGSFHICGCKYLSGFSLTSLVPLHSVVARIFSLQYCTCLSSKFPEADCQLPIRYQDNIGNCLPPKGGSYCLTSFLLSLVIQNPDVSECVYVTVLNYSDSHFNSTLLFLTIKESYQVLAVQCGYLYLPVRIPFLQLLQYVCLPYRFKL